MKSYVLGFALCPFKERVVLIQKNRPEWQAGKLNGIGGKIEEGETPEEAMKREFLEEAGVELSNWFYFAKMVGKGFEVFVFVHEDVDVDSCRTMTDEYVWPVKISSLKYYTIVSNIPWLLEMSQDVDVHTNPLMISYM